MPATQASREGRPGVPPPQAAVANTAPTRSRVAALRPASGRWAAGSCRARGTTATDGDPPRPGVLHDTAAYVVPSLEERLGRLLLHGMDPQAGPDLGWHPARLLVPPRPAQVWGRAERGLQSRSAPRRPSCPPGWLDPPFSAGESRGGPTEAEPLVTGGGGRARSDVSVSAGPADIHFIWEKNGRELETCVPTQTHALLDGRTHALSWLRDAVGASAEYRCSVVSSAGNRTSRVRVTVMRHGEWCPSASTPPSHTPTPRTHPRAGKAAF